MEKTLSIINQMQGKGLIEKYAIGGGIATLFYIEPIATFDLDIFIILSEDNRSLVSLSPLYKWLKGKGYNTLKEYVVIEGIPVQFIPVYNDLIKEAVLNAIKKKYKDTVTFVLQPEYLLAVMLQVNRPKDRVRILRLLEEADISDELLEQILDKYNLKQEYLEFRRKFYES